jgi:hypothetical protein
MVDLEDGSAPNSLRSFNEVFFITTQDTRRFLQRFSHFLDCGVPGGESLQLHVRASIKNLRSLRFLFKKKIGL